MPQPTLHTSRLRLVPLAELHLELEMELDSDPEVMRFVGGVRSRDETVAAHARRLAHAERVDGLGFWATYAGDEFVGLVWAPPAHGPDQPDDPTVCDLGYRLRRRSWGNGYATEASRSLLDHAFGSVGQSRVVAQTLETNAASRAVMERLGMRYVRTYDSEGDTEVEYDMTREMWAVVDRGVARPSSRQKAGPGGWPLRGRGQP
jgi:RimJ/RimL family protein N-acetyltransferase